MPVSRLRVAGPGVGSTLGPTADSAAGFMLLGATRYAFGWIMPKPGIVIASQADSTGTEGAAHAETVDNISGYFSRHVLGDADLWVDVTARLIAHTACDYLDVRSTFKDLIFAGIREVIRAPRELDPGPRPVSTGIRATSPV